MSTPRQWEEVRELFQAALELPPEAREALVRERTTDPVVADEVLSLLRVHPQAEGFLSSPADGGSLPGRARLVAGSRLGAFEIVGLIGAGGMGEVYRARDTRLDRTVAVKVLSSSLTGDPSGRERFEREARLVSQLNHPHICTLHDVGAATIDGDGVQFLVMELLEGETLAARLSRGPIPVEQALNHGLQIADALASAHAAGIVHRDVKPANIMLTKSGVKLLDFGLARLRARAGDDESDAVSSHSLTGHGLVLGTIAYMAPEQVRGADTDARTDLFAFGAVLYEMLTGRRAFSAASEPALVAAILEHQPPPPTRGQPLALPAVDHLVAACLAKDPGDRWQHAGDVVHALRSVIGQGTDSGQPQAALGGHGAAGGVPVRAVGRRWLLHAGWASVAAAVGLLVGTMRPTTAEPAAAVNPRPVVVLMDSPLPGRVYDARTLAAGGTNADDVSDALRDLQVLTFKENTSPIWHREEQVRAQNPDLVVSHLSCLLDQRFAIGNPSLYDHLFSVAESRLMGVFGYLATANPRVRFLVYSRGRVWPTPEAEATWTAGVVARFPQLRGRLFTMLVPGGAAATFRDPMIAEGLRTRIRQTLALP